MSEERGEYQTRWQQRLAYLRSSIGCGGMYEVPPESKHDQCECYRNLQREMEAENARLAGEVADLQRQCHVWHTRATVAEARLDMFAGDEAEWQALHDQLCEIVLDQYERAEQVEADVARLREALTECAEWLETRPDYTEGDAATSSRARAALGKQGEEVQGC